MALLTSKKWQTLLVLLLLLGGVGWWQHKTVWSWYCLRCLKEDGERDWDLWIGRLIDVDVAAQAQVLGGLASEDHSFCMNLGLVANGWIKIWPENDARCEQLVAGVLDRYPTFSVPGKRAALDVAAAACRRGKARSPHIVPNAERLIELSKDDQQLRPGVCNLAGAMLECAGSEPRRLFARELAVQSLDSPDTATRSAGVLLLLHKPMNDDENLLNRVVPLLRDPSSSVRHSALLVLASNKTLVSEDEFLPLLHDTDGEVVTLCERVLMSRGLKENHLDLARQISHANALERMKVFNRLQFAPELDVGAWLQRMTQDPEPAVRAAAIRAASTWRNINLRDRLQEMIQNDPSADVRAIAQFYLTRGE